MGLKDFKEMIIRDLKISYSWKSEKEQEEFKLNKKEIEILINKSYKEGREEALKQINKHILNKLENKENV